MSTSLLEEAKKALANNNLKLADEKLSKVIESQPSNLTAHLERAIVYQKLKEFDKALYRDCFNALTIAKQRSKNDVSKVYYRMGVLGFSSKNYNDSYIYFKLAKSYGYPDANQVDIWIQTSSNKTGVSEKFLNSLNDVNFNDEIIYKKLSSSFENKYKITKKVQSQGTGNQAVLNSNSSSDDFNTEKVHGAASSSDELVKSVSAKPLDKSVATKPNIEYPPQAAVKKEFFETPKTITIAIYLKKVPKDLFKLQFLPNAVEFEFKTAAGSDYIYELSNFVGEIDPKASTYTVFGTKIELILVKKKEELWRQISNEDESEDNKEDIVKHYPTSSTKNIDWEKVDEEYKNIEDEEEDDMKLFKQIFKNANEDTRRAMVKSYTESGGTSLSTNWDEVGKKTYEIDPPDGMVARSWEQ